MLIAIMRKMEAVDSLKYGLIYFEIPLSNENVSPLCPVVVERLTHLHIVAASHI